MKRKATRKKVSVRATRNGKRGTKVSRARRAPILQKRGDPLDALVAAHAQTLGLSLDRAWQDGVKFNLGLILRLAALVDNFPLPDESEPGPIFHA
jgi:hypothetical protein